MLAPYVGPETSGTAAKNDWDHPSTGFPLVPSSPDPASGRIEGGRWPLLGMNGYVFAVGLPVLSLPKGLP